MKLTSLYASLSLFVSLNLFVSAAVVQHQHHQPGIQACAKSCIDTYGSIDAYKSGVCLRGLIQCLSQCTLAPPTVTSSTSTSSQSTTLEETQSMDLGILAGRRHRHRHSRHRYRTIIPTLLPTLPPTLTAEPSVPTTFDVPEVTTDSSSDSSVSLTTEYDIVTEYEWEIVSDVETEVVTEYITTEYGTPTATETITEYATPTATETVTEYGTPTATETLTEYGIPTGIITEYGTPTAIETITEYGTPTTFTQYVPLPPTTTTTASTTAAVASTTPFVGLLSGCDFQTYDLLCPGASNITNGVLTYGKWDQNACTSLPQSTTSALTNTTYTLPTQYLGVNQVVLDATAGLNTIVGEDPDVGVYKQIQVQYYCN